MEFGEKIIAVAAIAVSIIALIYSIREGRLSQKHRRLSVKPILGFTLSTSAAYSRYALIIENNGLGPALIKNYRFLVDNASLKELKEKRNIDKWEDLSDFLNFPDKLDWQYLYKNNIINTGDKIEIVGYKYDNYSSDLAAKFRQAVRRLNIEIEYTSLYEKENIKESFRGKEDVIEE